MRTILQGPVGSAAHGGSINPWFSIGVGVLLLTSLWLRYLKGRRETKVPVGILLGITAICLVFIATGVWILLH
jgi:hypothetical protein